MNNTIFDIPPIAINHVVDINDQIMIHDLTQPPESSTKLIPILELKQKLNLNITPFGQFLVFKKPTNTDASKLQPGDIGVGLLSDGVTFIPFGQYLGGVDLDENININTLTNWNTSPIDFS